MSKKTHAILAVMFFSVSLILSGCIIQNKSKEKVSKSKETAEGAAPETKESAAVETETPNFQELIAGVEINNIDKVVLKTDLGEITLKLFPEAAPLTVANFVRLANQGFYDGVKFHRIIKNFMIQTGDPNSRDDNRGDDGQGGPGYFFNDEINPSKLTGVDENDIKNLEAQGYTFNNNLPISYNVVRGKLAMANSGPNTNGSQFFIVTKDACTWLDGKHTVFGEVASGMEVVDQIEGVATDEQGYPQNDIIVESVTVVRGESTGEGAAISATSTTTTGAGDTVGTSKAEETADSAENSGTEDAGGATTTE